MFYTEPAANENEFDSYDFNQDSPEYLEAYQIVTDLLFSLEQVKARASGDYFGYMFTEF